MVSISQQHSQLSIDIGVKAVIGFGIGCLTQTDHKLWAIILSTQAVAHYALAKLGQAVWGKQWSASTIEDSARGISYMVAIVALKEAGLVSLRMGGVLGFFTMAFFLANSNSNGNRYKRFETQPL